MAFYIKIKDHLDAAGYFAVRWLIEEGQYITSGRPILVVRADQEMLTLRSETDGILLRKNVQDGESFDREAALGTIVSREEAGEIRINRKMTAKDLEILKSLNQKSGVHFKVSDHLKATPAARRLAREYDVSLFDVSGTGPNGTIQRADIWNYLERTAKGEREKNPSKMKRKLTEIVGEAEDKEEAMEDHSLPVRATPLAQKIAKAFLVSLDEVSRVTGKRRITKKVMQDYLDSLSAIEQEKIGYSPKLLVKHEPVKEEVEAFSESKEKMKTKETAPEKPFAEETIQEASEKESVSGTEASVKEEIPEEVEEVPQSGASPWDTRSNFFDDRYYDKDQRSALLNMSVEDVMASVMEDHQQEAEDAVILEEDEAPEEETSEEETSEEPPVQENVPEKEVKHFTVRKVEKTNDETQEEELQEESSEEAPEQQEFKRVFIHVSKPLEETQPAENVGISFGDESTSLEEVQEDVSAHSENALTKDENKEERVESAGQETAFSVGEKADRSEESGAYSMSIEVDFGQVFRILQKLKGKHMKFQLTPIDFLVFSLMEAEKDLSPDVIVKDPVQNRSRFIPFSSSLIEIAKSQEPAEERDARFYIEDYLETPVLSIEPEVHEDRVVLTVGGLRLKPHLKKDKILSVKSAIITLSAGAEKLSRADAVKLLKRMDYNMNFPAALFLDAEVNRADK